MVGEKIMKFVCNGLVLSDACSTVVKACSQKTLTPILECIKLFAKNDSLVLSAYDGEISIEKTIKADILEEGEVCVNGRYFTDFTSKIVTLGEVKLSTNEKGLEIKYEDSVSYLQVLPGSDFPVIRKEKAERSFSVKDKDFKDLIQKTAFCCSQDDSRPILKGCLLETKENKLCSSALDGFRMAVAECPCSATEKIKSVAPARTLQEISRMIEDKGEDIEIEFTKNVLSITVGNTVLTSRLYLGEFVAKENIFPTAFETNVLTKREELLESIERASVLIRGDKNNLIIIEIKNSGITVLANSDMGNASESVKCDLTGKELKIAMNAKFISDALKALEDENVILSFNSAVAPFTLKNETKNDSEYLILPMRMSA